MSALSLNLNINSGRVQYTFSVSNCVLFTCLQQFFGSKFGEEEINGKLKENQNSNESPKFEKHTIIARSGCNLCLQALITVGHRKTAFAGQRFSILAFQNPHTVSCLITVLSSHQQRRERPKTHERSSSRELQSLKFKHDFCGGNSLLPQFTQ